VPQDPALAPLRVDTLPALQLARDHLASPDPALKAAAETLFSYLIRHLRNKVCEITPEAAQQALRRLMSTDK
jgi:hypothetical protein